MWPGAVKVSFRLHYLYYGTFNHSRSFGILISIKLLALNEGYLTVFCCCKRGKVWSDLNSV